MNQRIIELNSVETLFNHQRVKRIKRRGATELPFFLSRKRNNTNILQHQIWLPEEFFIRTPDKDLVIREMNFFIYFNLELRSRSVRRLTFWIRAYIMTRSNFFNSFLHTSWAFHDAPPEISWKRAPGCPETLGSIRFGDQPKLKSTSLIIDYTIDIAWDHSPAKLLEVSFQSCSTVSSSISSMLPTASSSWSVVAK